MPKYKFVALDTHSRNRFVVEIKAENLEEAKAEGLRRHKAKVNCHPAEIRVSRIG